MLAGNTRGAIWMLLSGLVTVIQSGLVKSLGDSFHTFEVVFWRCLFGLAILLPFALRHGGYAFSTDRFRLHFLRATLSITSMASSFYALARLPLADAIAYVFTAPLFIIPLAVIILGEVVRWRRWTATAVGFVGVIVMARPGGTMDPAVPVALFGASATALVFVIVKRLTETERVITVTTYFTLIGTLLSAIPAAFVWQTPSWAQLLVLFGVGAMGTMSQLFAVHGWRVGEATAIAPFDYARLLYAAVLGFLVFGEIPDEWTAAGAFIIVTSTLYIARREARLRRATPAAPRIDEPPGGGAGPA